MSHHREAGNGFLRKLTVRTALGPTSKNLLKQTEPMRTRTAPKAEKKVQHRDSTRRWNDAADDKARLSPRSYPPQNWKKSVDCAAVRWREVAPSYHRQRLMFRNLVVMDILPLAEEVLGDFRKEGSKSGFIRAAWSGCVCDHHT